jgi:Mg-chelatase subunit ChlD
MKKKDNTKDIELSEDTDLFPQLSNTDSFGDEELFDVIPDEFNVERHVNYDDNPEKIGCVNWFNGKPVLSFSSLCDKTKSIFTQVKGVPIIVRESNDENYIYKSEGSNGKSIYTINIAKAPINGISKYTAFNHELGHYAFDSFNTQFPEHINKQLEMIPKEHHDKALELYRSVFNIIEDQRIESLMGDIYLGIGKRFRQSRRRLGVMKDKNHKCINPLDALHCAREYRTDALNETKFKLSESILDDVELKDGEASVLLARKYIDQVLNPWIIAQLKNCKNPFPRSKNKPTNGDFKVDEDKPIGMTNKLEGAFQEAFNENRSSDHREMENSVSEEQENQLIENIINMDDGKLEETLKLSESNAESQIDKIKENIELNARKTKSSSMGNVDHVQFVDRSPEDSAYYRTPPVIPRPNNRIAKNINRVLKLINAKRKPKIRDTGDYLSIPHVIKRQAIGYGDVMVKTTPQTKISILVSIDASGSMDGSPITIARDMMATLYKSIYGIDNIELKGVVWAGGGAGCLISMVNSKKECNTIHCNSYSGGTPTAWAVEYCADVIKTMKAKKKLMIVITDGYPNSVSDSNLSAEQIVRKSINKCRKLGIGTMGLVVGIDECAMLDIMFGKEGYISVTNMEQASSSVIKKFRNVVLSQVNSR